VVRYIGGWEERGGGKSAHGRSAHASAGAKCALTVGGLPGMNVRSRSRTSSFPPGASIAARERFYMSSVSETGCPYVQHRGGSAGLLKVIGLDRCPPKADVKGAVF
jgi:hypothetical protein